MMVEVRPETTADIREIHQVNVLAFGQENEAELVDALRKSNSFVPELSLVAVKRRSIIGHILFTRIKIIDFSGNAFNSLALAPMSVRPGMQRKGIGSQLITSGLKKAKQLRFSSVIVLGHEHYYPRFGFLPANKWNIKAPFDVPSNVFMALELIHGILENVSGTVKYSKEFEGM